MWESARARAAIDRPGAIPEISWPFFLRESPLPQSFLHDVLEDIGCTFFSAGIVVFDEMTGIFGIWRGGETHGNQEFYEIRGSDFLRREILIYLLCLDEDKSVPERIERKESQPLFPYLWHSLAEDRDEANVLRRKTLEPLEYESSNESDGDAHRDPWANPQHDSEDR